MATTKYHSMMGIPELRQAIAAHYGRWQWPSTSSDDRGDGDVRRHGKRCIAFSPSSTAGDEVGVSAVLRFPISDYARPRIPRLVAISSRRIGG